MCFVFRRLVFRAGRPSHGGRLRGGPPQEEDRVHVRQVDRVPLLRRHRVPRGIPLHQGRKDRSQRLQSSEARAPDPRHHSQFQGVVASRPQAREQPLVLQLFSVHDGAQRNVAELSRKRSHSAADRLSTKAGHQSSRKRRSGGKKKKLLNNLFVEFS